jgi:hypothetical protein
LVALTHRVRAARLALRTPSFYPSSVLALLIASLMAQGVSGQTLVWSAPLYAQVPPWQIAPFGDGTRGTLADSPFMPDWDPDSRTVMLLSDVGEAGIVLAGRAQIGDSFQTQPPGTPWLAKVTRADGAPLWTWHFADYAKGYLAEAIVGADGDIVAIGTHFLPDTTFGLFVVKVDAATGAQRWRADGPLQDTFGTGIALDASGDVIVTAVHDWVAQEVTKYSGSTGTLLWSAGVPDPDAWDDALVAVDDAGDVVAAGGYEITENGQVLEDGLQVAKFRGSDGQLLWTRRFVSEFGAAVHALRILPGGDVAVAGGFVGDIELVRLDGDTGVVRWERGGLDAEDMLVDPDGRIVVAGSVNAPESSIPVEDIQRLDAADGSTLWRQQFYARTFSGAWRVSIGLDGQLLAGFTVEQDRNMFGAAGLDLETGALRWWFAPPHADADDDRFPVGIVQASDGAIYFGGFNYVPADDADTWTTFKLAPIAADTIFLGGFE